MFYLTKGPGTYTWSERTTPTIVNPAPPPSHSIGRHSYTHTHHYKTHTHTHTHSCISRDQPATIWSSRWLQSEQNTLLFTTIHHITFPQCHRLVLETSEKDQSYCEQLKKEEREGTVQSEWILKRAWFGFRWNKVVTEAWVQIKVN